mmetsp:Transcript_11211/g.14009  ORF Transcript_11211/g.14009 Transcript_11211/m.14009 type:complete len:103 (-) Transcript_11211:535-843(-)
MHSPQKLTQTIETGLYIFNYFLLVRLRVCSFHVFSGVGGNFLQETCHIHHIVNSTLPLQRYAIKHEIEDEIQYELQYIASKSTKIYPKANLKMLLKMRRLPR